MQLEFLQQALRDRGLSGWLFYDLHHRDAIAYRVLGLPKEHFTTRRWYYLVPATGEPQKLVHQIESNRLDALPGAKRIYAGWRELRDHLEAILAPVHTVAMQYSPNNQLPMLSLVDAGTVELIRSLGKQVVSSAELVQRFEATWSAAALYAHLEAGQRIDRIISSTFAEIGRRVRGSAATDEYAIQQFILERFRQEKLVTRWPPLVAANQNTSNPHYLPGPERSAPIRSGDFVLLDVWGKLELPGAVYYDVTWVGFLGERPPERIQSIFEIVRTARDAAVAAVQRASGMKQTLRGWEVDRVARSVIEQSGYGQYFLHRTGHSIGEEVHGNGANMDDLEMHDEREIIPCTGFSIEPGIYLPEFGVRSEVNLYVDGERARITGAVQNQIVAVPVGERAA
ncbi:MAG: M24 family metallopeptidase [Acidobacteria bacterium]|nr:M24 family metallopeptidase [Acidobacteriota bacterium]